MFTLFFFGNNITWKILIIIHALFDILFFHNIRTFIVLKYLLRIFFFSWIFHCQFKTGSYSLNWNVIKWNQIPFNIIMPFHKITKIRKLFLKRRYFWAQFRSRRVLKFYQPFWCKIKSFARKNRTESPSFAAFYHIIFIIW